MAGRSAALAAVAALTLAACGGDDEDKASAPAGTTTAATGSARTQATTAAADRATTVYMLRGEKLVPLRREVEAGPGIGAASLRALLEGPAEDERGVTTAIPAGTRLLGLDIDADGTATADLSAQFDAGGGSLSMRARLAQVVFTLTRFPTVKRVTIAIDGEAVDALGGEGVEIGDGVDRGDFEDISPILLVESPLPGEAVSSPLRIRGTANAFEANFIVEVRDADGTRLGRDFVTATSGSGTRGTFDKRLPFKVPAGGGEIELVAFEESAENGKPVNVVRIPLRLR